MQSDTIPSSQKESSQSHHVQHSSGNIIEMNPWSLRFSQDTVHNPKHIGTIEISMKTIGWNDEPIHVVLMPDGKYTTLDNRRVITARKAGIYVKAMIHHYNDPLDSANRQRFTTTPQEQYTGPETWGKAIQYRISNQNSFYMRNVHPYGTFDEPYITGEEPNKLVNKPNYDLPENAVEKSKQTTAPQHKNKNRNKTAATDHTSADTPAKSQPSKVEADNTSDHSHATSKPSMVEADHTSEHSHAKSNPSNSESNHSSEHSQAKSQPSKVEADHTSDHSYAKSKSSNSESIHSSENSQAKSQPFKSEADHTSEHSYGTWKPSNSESNHSSEDSHEKSKPSKVEADHTSEHSYAKSKPSKSDVEHISSREQKCIRRTKSVVGKSILQRKQTSHVSVRIPTNVRRRQTHTGQIWRAHNQQVPVKKSALSGRALVGYVSYDQKVETSTRCKGLIKTTTEYSKIVFNGSKGDCMYEKRCRTHANPIYKTKTITEVGKNQHNPTENYNRVRTKYYIGSRTKAAAKAGIKTAIDKALYAAFATDKGRPSVGEVATAVGAAVVNSVVPGGRLLTTLGASIAAGNYENLPVDLPLAATSLIPGNPIHFEHQQTQANAALFGSDLRSDNVDRYSADLSVPYLSDLASVGLCLDREQIEFSRNGVRTNRDATAVNAHASIGNTFDASIGFSSGIETSDPVTKETADGMTETTYWKKEFSGQLGARVRAADKKAAWDIGSAFNEVTTTTTITTATDTRPSTILESLSPTHLKKTIENVQTYFGLSAPTHDHGKRVHGEKIVVEEKSQFFGHRTDKTKTTSNADGAAYEVRESENTIGTSTVREIEKDYFKKIQHFDTANEIASTIGQKDTISTVRNVDGILQPEVTTTIRETQQTFERTNETTTFQDPHLVKTLDVKQSYGLLTNKTEVSAKTFINGEDTPEETTSEVVETLGGAAHSALSSLTSNVLHMACDPAARTIRNVRNTVINVGVQGAVGWAHTAVAIQQNSVASTAVAAIVNVAANGVTKVCSSNDDTLSTKTVLTDTALSSASSVVSLAVNVSANIPIPLKAHASAITSLIIRTSHIIQNYRSLTEAINAIIQEITFIIANCGIQAYLVPELVALLPLGPLGTSIAACIAGAALSFASFKTISWMMDMSQERVIKQEYDNLCKDLEVNSTDTDAAINSRYRRLALQVHPDKVGGDAAQFKKLTKDFERLHELRSRYNIQPDRSQTRNIIQMLEEFLKDPMCFIRYLSQMVTPSSVNDDDDDDFVVIESPLMLTA